MQTLYEDQVGRLHHLVVNYCQSDPIHEANERVSVAVEEFNRWLEEQSHKLDAESLQLQQELDQIRCLESELEELKKKIPNLSSTSPSRAEVELHNRLVADFNAQVARHRQMAGEYKARQDSYNQCVAQYNEEAKSRRNRVEEIRQKAQAQATAHRNWLEHHGPELLTRELNQLFAKLLAEKRGNAPEALALEILLTRLRKLRVMLGEHAQAQEEQSAHGLLVVTAMVGGLGLGQAEECRLVVDNGASISALTPEMVEALGLQDLRGEEVELSLPNGIRIKAPQLVIPSLSVDGHTAEFVRAVVLHESSPGVDGTLGLSFLSRFDFKIHKGKPQGLELDSLKGQSTFDVFICHKSQDFAYAQRVYEVLKKAGYRTFLSEVALEKSASGNYHKDIDMAIAGASAMVVICSCPESLASGWVEGEWRRFDTLILAGRKVGKIVPVLCGAMTANDLPPALFQYSAVFMNDDPGWSVKLLAALPRL